MLYTLDSSLLTVDTDEARERISSLYEKEGFKLYSSMSQKDEPKILIEDPYIFVRNSRSVYDLARKFGKIFCGHRVIAFNENGRGTFNLDKSELQVLEPLNPEPLDIVTYAHNRDHYFQLTLNSWLYSLRGFNYRLHIFLSKPNEKVKNMALNLKHDVVNLQDNKIFLYETENNIAYACVNLFLQHIRPKSFMIFEDDFIIPQKTKHLIPHWPSRFKDALEKDRATSIHFETSIQNLPFDFLSRPMAKIEDSLTQYHFVTERLREKEPRITGNGMAIKTENYIKYSELKPPFYVTPDGEVARNSVNSVTLGITGYHLGFNQEMDALGSYTDGARFPVPEETQTFFDYQTNKKHTYNLSKLRELF